MYKNLDFTIYMFYNLQLHFDSLSFLHESDDLYEVSSSEDIKLLIKKISCSVHFLYVMSVGPLQQRISQKVSNYINTSH